MTLTINTNIASIIAERNLNNATNSLNRSLERLSTGYKINHASDNAAGYSIADMWTTQIGSLDIAAANASTGADLLQTAEQTYGLLTDHLQRIRDLTVQAANGTYGSASLKAIKSEITARLDEVDRITANCEYNGRKMMNGSIEDDINLQVGLYSSEDSQIELDSSLFANANIATLFGEAKATVAEKCAGLNNGTTASAMLNTIDNVIKTISDRTTTLGAAQNRIDSAIESIGVQSENITSSLSTLRDADIAKESSNFIQAQILQQAASTLLSTANQTPAIALNLL